MRVVGGRRGHASPPDQFGETTVDSLEIRVASLADKDMVESILAASYGALLRGYYTPAVRARVIPVMTRANLRLLSSGQYFLAFDQGAPLGCGGWSRAAPGAGQNPPTSHQTAHLRHFATHGDHVGKGVARRIVHVCEQTAAKDGVTRMHCQSSLMAEGFYARLGYRHLKFVHPIIAGAPFACVVMDKSISPDVRTTRRSSM